jgi:phage anti-repressor protein
LEDGIKQYDFVQGVDYDLLHRIVEQVSGAKKRKDCIISIDMAKEFSIA